MLTYYDERAPEYEEAYTLGTGTASIPAPEVFKTEARVLAGIVGRFAHGRLIDLACGTAYWLPHYAPNCSRITLFDQSAKMLTEGRAKAHSLGIVDRCDFFQGDFFEHEFGQAACQGIDQPPLAAGGRFNVLPMYPVCTELANKRLQPSAAGATMDRGSPTFIDGCKRAARRR
jgi:SAM-dependent methyltransferase